MYIKDRFKLIFLLFLIWRFFKLKFLISKVDFAPTHVVSQIMLMDWNIHECNCALDGCKSWYLTWRVNYSWRAFFGTVLKKAFRTKREDLRGGWIKIASEELNDFHSPPNTILSFESRTLIWVGCVACIGSSVVRTGVWVGKPARNIPFWRLKCSWDDNIEMYVTEMGWNVVVWKY
jgi:hypothetical protein